ncbi:hypothetical protein ACFO9Q_04865 [Paenibacillus sp. GCM10023252]|uniref:hypothetical protein n=1 Tax=Paenibacillus sp. GCM10023252 TaxID=3252649 RepID=UPI0036121DEE
MEFIMNQSFENETIRFDGYSFISCTFTNCVIIITTLDFGFEQCTFYGSSLHVNPELPVFQISHRLSQSSYDSDTTCQYDDYKQPRTTLPLRKIATA